MSKQVQVRVYGQTFGNGSMTVVSRGMVEGLEALGAFAGFVPVNEWDGTDQYPGQEAEVAVYVGEHAGIPIVRNGQHKLVFGLVAVNSSWVPSHAVQAVEEQGHILAPSYWAADTIRASGLSKKQISVWHHGYDGRLQYLPEQHRKLEESIRDGHFGVLHLTSSRMERKGTLELCRAWPQVVKEVPGALLMIVSDAHPDTYGNVLRESGAHPETWAVMPRMDAGPEVLSRLYQSAHCVCQPSRGEGFGMVPIEARACGIPVVQTHCTGHESHWDKLVEPAVLGIVEVPTGPLGAIDDGPGALAPMVEPSAIAESLLCAHFDWDALHRASVLQIGEHERRWSWRATTAQWFNWDILMMQIGRRQVET